MTKKVISAFAIAAFMLTSAQASWVIVNDDGSTEPLAPCCGKKYTPKKVVKKKHKAPEVCETCDYSQFPEANLLPYEGEKLAPATLKNCGK